MHQGRRDFLARCRKSGHLEILFWAAVSDLFLSGCRFAGMETMHAVAAQGHSVPQYTVSMMLMLGDDAELKSKGLETFHGLEAAGALTICKLHYPRVVDMSALRASAKRRESSLCFACMSKPWKLGCYLPPSMLRKRCYVNDGDRGAARVSCINCRANYELILFVHLFD
ncbi:hypothetical protein Ahy_A03g013351 [Arachis hypogaea]|uniref:At2g35280-like TPR domain-containing protein n=1 Tax=Arachis hypogaea TaxID=3818 RepID=A0A445DV90_ARAHY|nr:hypothetical protein Ahy_A03g013351 [Arachis hypogaea]